MKFWSRRDLFVNCVTYGAIGVLLGPLYPILTGEGKAGAGAIAFTVFCLAISGLLLWVLYGTRYTIENESITYRSGPFKGAIDISRIHTVISGKNLYTGYRPATARKGLIVKYGKYDEIYFSPHTNESFIAELLRINPSIKVEIYK